MKNTKKICILFFVTFVFFVVRMITGLKFRQRMCTKKWAARERAPDGSLHRVQNANRRPNRTCRGTWNCGPPTICEIGFPVSGSELWKPGNSTHPL